MEQRYADGAGRRLSLTMDKWGGDRPFDLTVPRVSDNPPPPPPPPPPPAGVPFFNLGAAPADAASAPYRSKGKAPTHPFGHWPTAPAPIRRKAARPSANSYAARAAARRRTRRSRAS